MRFHDVSLAVFDQALCFLQNFMFTDCHNFFRISTFNYKHMNEINNLNVARYKYLIK